MSESQISENTQDCPLCGMSYRIENTKNLYGHKICKKCYYAFAYRRHVAFVIDFFLFGFLSLIIFEKISEVLGILSLVLFLIKDGFKGYSPGKALLGLRAIDVDNGKPIGPWRSFKRNFFIVIPILFPLFPLIVFFQLFKGYRPGDGLSQSKVIWQKYSSRPIFLPTFSDEFIWTEEEAERALSRALKIEIKGDFDNAIILYNKVITGYPETQIAKDAEISLKALKEKIDSSIK